MSTYLLMGQGPGLDREGATGEATEMLHSKRPPLSAASELVLPADCEARSAQRFQKESREAVPHPFSQSPKAILTLSAHDRHLS